ncbi:MAG: hypothetical protein EXR54_02725 [Dehalococcoidia bacterium]|nr:hypothetical protein [Dehalococcoidia bacterium]MSQ16471.1 hypothetical protein [Dehalococcoidia bacterium]
MKLSAATDALHAVMGVPAPPPSVAALTAAITANEEAADAVKTLKAKVERGLEFFGSGKDTDDFLKDLAQLANKFPPWEAPPFLDWSELCGKLRQRLDNATTAVNNRPFTSKTLDMNQYGERINEEFMTILAAVAIVHWAQLKGLRSKFIGRAMVVGGVLMFASVTVAFMSSIQMAQGIPDGLNVVIAFFLALFTGLLVWVLASAVVFPVRSLEETTGLRGWMGFWWIKR